MISIYPELCLGRLNQGEKAWKINGDLGHLGVTDEHPSKHFHKLISDLLLHRFYTRSELVNN